MKKIIPLLFVITSLTVAEEVSVYGASNQDSSYGLSASEKHILKNQSNMALPRIYRAVAAIIFSKINKETYL